MKLSLVIPCYNEAESLPELTQKTKAIGDAVDCEVIFVDNGSTDSTAQDLPALLPLSKGFRSVRVPVNQGYGFGILSGLRAAKGRILAWTHADLQTDPLDVLKALSFFEETDEPLFVKGSRHGRPLSDVIFTLGMSFFETLLLGRRLWDINAQPTLMRKDFFDSWVQPPHDFSLDLFAYYSAKRLKMKICRFPVLFGDRKHGQSHWNIDWKSKWKFIKRTIDYSLRLAREVGK